MEFVFSDKKLLELASEADAIVFISSKNDGFLQFKLLGNDFFDLILPAVQKEEFIFEKSPGFSTFANLNGKQTKVILIGTGKKPSNNVNFLARAFCFASNALNSNKAKSVVIVVEKDLATQEEIARAVIEAFLLGSYSFEKFKKENSRKKSFLEKIIVSVEEEKIIDSEKIGKILNETRIVCGNVVSCRDLINLPASIKTPEFVSSLANGFAGNGLKAKVLGKKELEELKMNLLLAVGKASSNEPKLVVLEYNNNPNSKPIVLIGKGITFDSGGLNLKPASGMETMKDDMSGAAAVLFAMKSIAELKLKVNVIGILALAENAIGEKAFKPGDIIESASGISVEVLNTDAEGRLVLADAIHFAKKFEPIAIIDFATLTGACVSALGNDIAGLLGNDKELIEKIKVASEKSFEKVWELPLEQEYSEQLKSDFADIKNVSSNSTNYAGTITAALFLQKFVENHKWAHLDIAGPSWSDKDKDIIKKGGTGFGIRLIIELLKNWIN